MNGLNDEGNNGAGWEDIGLSIHGYYPESTIPGETQEVVQGGMNDILGADQRQNPRTIQSVSRLAQYGENIPAHHQALEQIFAMIEEESGDNEIIQKLLQEVIKTTEETKTLQSTTEKALECLFGMEIRGCKNHKIYMNAVGIVKAFFPKAFDKKAIEAYNETIHWGEISERKIREIGDKARLAWDQAISTDERSKAIMNEAEKIRNLRPDYSGLEWGFFMHQFSYEQIEALKKSGHFDENRMSPLHYPYTADVIWDKYIHKMRTNQGGIMEKIRNQITGTQTLQDEAIGQTIH